MSDQYTPGPWIIEETARGWAKISAANGGWYEFAKVAVTMDREPSEEGLANANLIAAAPELLEALEMVADNGHADDCWMLCVANGKCDCGVDLAFAAIAKAKGETK